MSTSIPFFPGFARILFGRPPVDAAVAALKEAARSDDAISELTTSFGHFFGAALKNGPAVDEQEPVQYRDRSYTQQITFWAFLLQVLNPGCACREVVRRLQLWWHVRDEAEADFLSHGRLLPGAGTPAFRVAGGVVPGTLHKALGRNRCAPALV